MAALGKAAAALAARGLRVFPLQPRDKKPDGQLAPHGCKDASVDAEEIAAWWEASPEANIGIATGEASAIWVLDVDGADGMTTLAELVAAHGPLPKTVVSITGTGKHYLFKWPADGISNSAKKLGPGLDTRGAGGYIVAPPSVHPSGTKYAWANTSGKAILDAPDWLLALLKKPVRKRAEAVTTPATPDFQAVPEAYGRKALESEYDAVASAGEGTRNGALNKAAFNMGTLAAVDGVKWPDVNRTLTAAAAANGYLAEEGAPHVEAVIRSGFESGLQHPREVKPSNKPARGQRPRLAAKEGQILETDGATALAPELQPAPDLSLNAKGELKANSMRNIARLLDREEATRGLFAWDDHAAQLILTRRPPWAVANGFTPGCAITDADETGAVMFLEDIGQSASINSVHAAIGYLASENHVHAVRSWMKAIQWDGVERLQHWLCDYLEADDTPFSRAVAAKWMIGAVARVMQPGSKVDTMLILEGPQGLKKSTALATLATIDGVEYFADRLSSLGGKETAMEMQGKLIIEIAELDALRRAEVSQIKAFLSQRFDRYRMPWGRNAIDRPRQCVFAGTVNPGGIGYLNDPTGGRRFWPVEVRAIDIAALARDREQLWAEAVHQYRAGATWWLEDEHLVDAARVAQEDRYDTDVWAPAIDAFLKGRRRVRIDEILTDCLDMKSERQNGIASKRVAQHLRHRKWERKRIRDPSRDNHPTSYFVAPDYSGLFEEK